MKKNLLISALFLCTLSAIGQSKNNKFGFTVGGSIQHYNGNLGNSFFKFNSVCFAGVVSNFGVYMNKSFDLNLGASIGHFGFHPQHEDGEIVPLELRCPGCDGLGMGELRSLMVSGNIAVKYKFANDRFLKENSKLAPYIYAGIGMNHLSDNMKKQCVNVGNHFSINAGAGLKYNITEKFNISYNCGIGCFTSRKVYNTANTELETIVIDADYLKAEKRKDFYMQNSISLGINFN